MTVVRVRGQGALGRTISSTADPQPTFAAEFCYVLSREGVPFSPRQLLAKIRGFPAVAVVAIAAVHESAYGTWRTFGDHDSMSVIG